MFDLKGMQCKKRGEKKRKDKKKRRKKKKRKKKRKRWKRKKKMDHQNCDGKISDELIFLIFSSSSSLLFLSSISPFYLMFVE